MSEDINTDEIENIELIDSSRTNRGKEYEWTPNTDRWTKGDEDRLYFNDSQYVDYIDLTSGFGHREGSAVTISTDLDGDELHVEVEVYEKTYSATFKLHGLETEADEDDESEIACDGGEDVTSHVDDATIEDAIESNDDPDHPDALTVEEVRDLLACIQRGAEIGWSEWMDNVEDGQSEVVADTGDYIVLSTGEHNAVSEELELAYEGDVEIDSIAKSVVTQIHHELARERCDYDWSVTYPYVIRKAEGTRDGQRYVEAVVNSLMSGGLSPGQAWAVYGVHVAGHSRNMWASMCGYSDHSAISEPLRKAEKKAGHLGLFH